MALPGHWAQTTVGDICRLTNGMVFRPSDWSQSGVPIVRIQNLNSPEVPFNYYDGLVDPRFSIRPGDLLFAWSGTPGTSFGAHIWTGPNAVLNQHIFKLDFDHSAVDATFLREAINQTLDEQEAKSHGGVGLRHVTRQAFSSTAIPFPPYAEQVRIADALARLGSRLDGIGRAVDTVRDLAAPARLAVLQAAFSGDLTKAWRSRHSLVESVDKLLARVPEPEQPRGGRQATTDVIQGQAGISVNNPGLPVPEGWRWVSLHRLARQETGHTPSRSNPEYWHGTIPWLGIKDARAHHGERVNHTLQSITSSGLENSSTRLLPPGTVCLSRTASVGYVTILGVEMTTSQDFATWTCGAALLPEYLMYALMSEGPAIRRFGEGSVHTTIYFPEIRALHIRLAPLEEQREIVRLIGEALSRIDKLLHATDHLAEKVRDLRRGVSALAFQGRLTAAEEGDGSAADQLARVRVPDTLKPVTSALLKGSRRSGGMNRSLRTILEEAAPNGLPAQEAFRRCGIGNSAETEAVEQVYAELRALDQAKLLISEPIFDENGLKIQDHLRLVS